MPNKKRLGNTFQGCSSGFRSIGPTAVVQNVLSKDFGDVSVHIAKKKGRGKKIYPVTICRESLPLGPLQAQTFIRNVFNIRVCAHAATHPN